MSNIIIGGPTQFTNKIVASPTGQNRITIAPRPADVAFTAVYQKTTVFDVSSGIEIQYTDITTAATNVTTNDVQGPYSSSDGPQYTETVTLYIGFIQPFNAVKINLAAGGDPAEVLSWKYFNGTETSVSNIQETVLGLKNMNYDVQNLGSVEGNVYWNMPNDWILSQPDGSLPSLYWISITPTFDVQGSPLTPRLTSILKSTPP